MGAGWRMCDAIPAKADRRSPIKACRYCQAPIRLVMQATIDGGRRTSAVDAIPKTSGWFHMFDDGMVVYDRTYDGRGRIMADDRYVTSFGGHSCEHVNRYAVRKRWARVARLVDEGLTKYPAGGYPEKLTDNRDKETP